MAEETLLIKLQFDFSQPATSVKEIEARVKGLVSTLKEIPQQGTPAFDELAQTISQELGVSIDVANKKITEFTANATQEVNKGKAAVKEFNDTLKQTPQVANSIGAIEAQVKSLTKEIKTLDINTQEFADKSAELSSLKNALRDIKQQAGLVGPSLSQLAADFSKQFSGLSKVVKTFFGFSNIRAGVGTLRSAFNGLIADYKDSNAAAADVDKGLKGLKQSIDSAALSFLEANREGINQFIKFLTDSIPVLRENAGLILKVVAALALYANAQKISSGITIAARVATIAYQGALLLLQGQLKATESATKALNNAFKANPIGILVTVIGALILVFTELYNRNIAFKEAVDKAFASVQEFIFGNEALQKALASVGEIFEQVIQFTGGLIAVIAGLIVGIIDFVRESGILQAILDGIQRVITNTVFVINLLISAYKNTTAAVSGFIESNSTLKFIVDSITGAFQRLIEVVQNIPALFAGIRSAVAAIGANITGVLKKIEIDARISAERIASINPFSGRSADEINANIEALREQRRQIDEESIGVAEAFKKGYNDAVEGQKAFAAEQKKLAAEAEAQNKILFAAFKKRADASASLTAEQRAVLKKDISETKKLTGQQKQQLEDIINQSAQAASKINQTLSEQLSERKSKLESSIKDLILSGKNYEKQLEQLRKVTEKLTAVEEEFAAATRFNESELERLQRRQQELTASIKEAISTGQDYSTEQEELTATTLALNKVQKEFDDIIKSINSAVKEYADGSLADYDKQLSDLQENQKNLNVTSDEYLAVTAQIEALEKDRNFVLELLKVNAAEYAQQQVELNNSLADATASETAKQIAIERIKAVTDATEEGAKEIEAIQLQLENDLKQIDNDRLRSRKAEIDAELQALTAQKNEELAKVEGNETLKLAVLKRFEGEQTALLVEASNVNSELLAAELEQYTSIQAQKTEVAKTEEDKRRALLEQTLSTVGEFSGKIFELIGQAQQQAFDKQKETLDAAEAADLKKAESFGASEAAQQRIRQEYAAKKEALEQQQARKEKQRAITQALIDQSLLVLKALATAPAPNVIAGGIAFGLAALQIALIASRKFELGDIFDMQVRSGQRFARGTYLQNGRYHSQGGMPIINPITGQKVAEIEKGEAIINKRTMSSRDNLTLSGTPYEIASALNSYKGYGVRFPNAKKYSAGGLMKKRNPKFALGGRFGISPNVLRLQSGAVFNAAATQEIKQLTENNKTNQLLETMVGLLAGLNQTTEQGFNSQPTTTDELLKINQLKRDEQNAA